MRKTLLFLSVIGLLITSCEKGNDDNENQNSEDSTLVDTTSPKVTATRWHYYLEDGRVYSFIINEDNSVVDFFTEANIFIGEELESVMLYCSENILDERILIDSNELSLYKENNRYTFEIIRLSDDVLELKGTHHNNHRIKLNEQEVLPSHDEIIVYQASFNLELSRFGKLYSEENYWNRISPSVGIGLGERIKFCRYSETYLEFIKADTTPVWKALPVSYNFFWDEGVSSTTYTYEFSNDTLYYTYISSSSGSFGSDESVYEYIYVQE